MKKFKARKIKFSPKHLTKEELEHVKELDYKNTKGIYNRKGNQVQAWVATAYIPSDKSKEIWAILYNTTPDKLK